MQIDRSKIIRSWEEIDALVWRVEERALRAKDWRTAKDADRITALLRDLGLAIQVDDGKAGASPGLQMHGLWARQRRDWRFFASYPLHKKRAIERPKCRPWRRHQRLHHGPGQILEREIIQWQPPHGVQKLAEREGFEPSVQVLARTLHIG
jgi:hypothetical protein